MTKSSRQDVLDARIDHGVSRSLILQSKLYHPAIIGNERSLRYSHVFVISELNINMFEMK